MPTATSFSWTFPWEQMVGAFNSFIGMLNTPVALGVALILVFAVSTFVVNLVQKARQERAVDEAMTGGEVRDIFNAAPNPSGEEPDFDDYTEEEQREIVHEYLFSEPAWLED